MENYNKSFPSYLQLDEEQLRELERLDIKYTLSTYVEKHPLLSKERIKKALGDVFSTERSRITLLDYKKLCRLVDKSYLINACRDVYEGRVFHYCDASNPQIFSAERTKHPRISESRWFKFVSRLNTSAPKCTSMKTFYRLHENDLLVKGHDYSENTTVDEKFLMTYIHKQMKKDIANIQDYIKAVKEYDKNQTIVDFVPSIEYPYMIEVEDSEKRKFFMTYATREEIDEALCCVDTQRMVEMTPERMKIFNDFQGLMVW